MRITPKIIERFTEGDCWLLALEIARHNPAWAVATIGTINGWPNHAIAVRGSLAIDVRGCRSLQRVLMDWMGDDCRLQHVFANVDEAAEFFAVEEWDHQDAADLWGEIPARREVAAKVARTLLKRAPERMAA